MHRLGGVHRSIMGLMLLAALMMVLGGCIIRTNARTGHHKHGVRHKHSHCHDKKVKRKGRDHRAKKHRVCHSHVHGHPHH